jgi:hypothetical protein
MPRWTSQALKPERFRKYPLESLEREGSGSASCGRLLEHVWSDGHRVRDKRSTRWLVPAGGHLPRRVLPARTLNRAASNLCRDG